MRTLAALLLLSACSSAPNILSEPAPEPTVEKKDDAPKYSSIDPVLRKRILVLPFINRSDHQDESLVRTALFNVQQAVTNSPELLLVKETDLDDPESLYSAGGEYHFRKVFEQAKRSAATGVIIGRIEEISVSEPDEDTGVLGAKERMATARVHFQLFDVGTEKEVFARTASAEVKQERVPWLDLRTPNSEPEEGKEAVSRALKKILDRFPVIARKLAWQGRIARVDLNRFYITGGEQTGLRNGQLLRVYEAGTTITDPVNGAAMGLAPGRFKGLLKVTQTFGPDASVAVLHTGAGFREDDRVEIHNPDNT